MTENNLPSGMVQALIEKKFCVPGIAPTCFFEWWLIVGAMLLALAWLWPSICGLRRWLGIAQSGTTAILAARL
jgi:hypothetical protein